jgi:hypothetical protein
MTPFGPVWFSSPAQISLAQITSCVKPSRAALPHSDLV